MQVRHGVWAVAAGVGFLVAGAGLGWAQSPASGDPVWTQRSDLDFGGGTRANLVIQGTGDGAALALEGWAFQYRRPITIDNSAGAALADFQVNITLDATTFDFTRTQPDGADIRFVDADDTSRLDYWIEWWDANQLSASVWVRVPEIPQAGSKAIFLYYGSSESASVASFDETFTKQTSLPDLVGLFHFDEAAGEVTTDDSGNGNTGFLRDGPGWQTTDGGQWDGLAGTAFGSGSHLWFDGNDDYVEGANAGNGFPTGGSARTICAWVRSRDTAGADRCILHYGTAENAPTSFHLFLTGGGQAWVGNGYGFGGVQSDSVVDDQQWHFVAGVYEGPDSNLIRVYVDGIEERSRTMSTVPETGTGSNWRIGEFMAGGGAFTGAMDEVRVYSRALNAGEILALFERREYTPVPPVLSVGLEEGADRLVYRHEGEYVSPVYDTATFPEFTTVAWTADVPAETHLGFQLRSAATAGELPTLPWLGPTGTPASVYDRSGMAINSILNGKRLIQWRALFTTASVSFTPVLDDVSLGYYERASELWTQTTDTDFAGNTLAEVTVVGTGTDAAVGIEGTATAGEMTSAPFDTALLADFGTLWWGAQTPAGTSVQFQVRTARFEADLTTAAWQGPTGPDDFYVTSGTTLNPALNGQRWLQYRALLATDIPGISPTLQSVSIEYAPGDLNIEAYAFWPESIYRMNSLTVANGATLTLAGGSEVSVTVLFQVIGGSAVVCQGKNTTGPVDGVWAGAGVSLSAGDLTVEAGSRITADGQGYTGWIPGSSNGVGPGAGISSGGCPASGGGHGGPGGTSGGGHPGGAVYGSFTEPVDLGSSGSSGDGSGSGAGGGAIRLDVAGVLTVDGAISANGWSGNGRNGSGAGGSIWMTVGTLRGTGTVAAVGGDRGGCGYSGAGGGGRVAVYYDTATGFDSANLVACGGTGWQNGGPGTVYLKASGQESGDLQVDNAGRGGAPWTWVEGASFHRLTVRNSAGLTVTGSGPFGLAQVTLGGGAGLAYQGTALLQSPDDLLIPGGSALTLGPGGTIAAPNLSVEGSLALGSGSTVAVPGLLLVGLSGSMSVGPDSTVTTPQATVEGMSTLALGGGSTLDVAGLLLVTGNSAVVCQGKNTTGQVDGAWVGAGPVILAGDVIIEAGSQVTATGQGYGGVSGGWGLGPGGGATGNGCPGGGGGHGGLGGYSCNWRNAGGPAYGSLAMPVELGSSGGNGRGDWWSGAGGGAICLVVERELLVEGAIAADGATGSGHAGHGAGGSIWVTTGTLSGTGYIHADGGSAGGNNGGGGGGRIALHYGDAGGFDLANVSACGGAGWQNGGAGTIYLKPANQELGDLQLDNAGQAGPGPTFEATSLASLTVPGGYACTISGGGEVTLGEVVLGSGASLSFAAPTTVHIADALVLEAGTHVSLAEDSTLETAGLVLTGGSAFTVGAHGSVRTGSATIHSGSVLTLGGGSMLDVTNLLEVTGNSTIVGQGKDTTGVVDGVWAGAGVTINAGDLTVEAGSRITADGQGYTGTNGAGNGPGAGIPTGRCPGAGGGYGGWGGRACAADGTGGAVYGSVVTPVDLGSSGSTGSGTSGAGGGAMRLEVDGRLTLDGVLSADGMAGDSHSGNGSGGSIWVTAADLAGTGQIHAHGGAGGGGDSGGGGGAGGRIAVYYTDATGFDFANVSAHGGTGWQNGGAGTVYLKAAADELGDLRVDTGGVPGPSLTVVASGSFGGLVVAGGANLTVTDAGEMTMRGISVDSGGVLTFAAPVALAVPVLDVDGGSTLNLAGGSTLDVTGLLSVTGNSIIVCQGKNTTGQVDGLWAGVGVTIDAGDVTVEAGSRITADGQGYASANGGGLGPGGAQWSRNCPGGGGGYGGYGGYGANWHNAGGSAYGSSTEPLDLGSSGSGSNSGAGGGAIRLKVAGALVLDGVVSANGSSNPNSGGGGGGSVWVTTGTLAGSGSVSGEGGYGGCGGGGGGGRVAIYYGDAAGFDLRHISVAGGGGWRNGGTGTVYLQDSTPDGPFISATSPPEHTSSAGVSAITLTLSSSVAGAGARDPATCTLLALGPDRAPGGLDDRGVPLTSSYTDGTTELVLNLRRPLEEGRYQLTVRSGIDAGLHDSEGRPLDQNRDGFVDDAVFYLDVDLTPPVLAHVGSGSALLFDGADDFVVTPNLGSFLDAGRSATIELWFCALGPGVILAEASAGAPNSGYWHASAIEVLPDGQVQARIWDLNAITLGTVGFGEWHHAAVAYDYGLRTLVGYLDGVAASETAVGFAHASWDYNVGLYYLLGATDSTNLGSGAWFRGAIADFRVWDVARDAAAIGTDSLHPLTGQEPGLIDYWCFDQGSGASVADLSGHGNTGWLGGGNPSQQPLRIPCSAPLARTALRVRFDDAGGMDPGSALDVANYRLVASGGDGSLGDGNEIDASADLQPLYLDPVAGVAAFLLPGAVAAETYQLTIRGAGGVRDLAGNELNGGLDAVATGRFFASPQDLRGMPDLVPVWTSVWPGGVNLEQAISVTTQIVNAGHADAGPFTYQYYLSTDPVITVDDTPIGGWLFVSGLGGLATYTQTDQLHVPADAPTGRFYIGALLDVNGDVAEADEVNNTIAILDLPQLTIWPPFGPRQPSELRVNRSSGGDQTNVDIAANAVGDAVAVWQGVNRSGWGTNEVYGQRLTRWGTPVGPEFQVNPDWHGEQMWPHAAVAADGRFVVAWTADNDGGSQGVYARQFGPDGAANGDAFRVNTWTTGDQQTGGVACNAAGSFVVVWQSNGQDGSGWGVHGQRFTATGTPQGDEFRVNTWTAGDQCAPVVAMSSAGDFVVVWQSNGQDGSGWGVYGQRFGEDGVPRGSEFRVNAYTDGDQSSPAVAMGPAGDFVVVWQSNGQDGWDWGIYGQRYDSDGRTLGGEFRANTYTPYSQCDPAVAVALDGRFAVTWTSWGQDSSAWGVYVQRYEADGTALGFEFPANAYVNDQQYLPVIAAGLQGDFLLAWQSTWQDGSGWGIGARLFGGSLPQPDLIPALVRGTGGASLGQALSVSAEIWNQGSVDAGAFTCQYYLCADPQFTAAAVPLGTPFTVNGLAACASVADSRCIPLPAVEPGDWYVSLAVDVAGAVAESDETNNAYPPSRNDLPVQLAPIPRFGLERQVNSYTAGEQSSPAVAVAATGGSVVVWQSRNEDGSGFGVYGQLFDASGAAVGGEFQVNEDGLSDQGRPAVAMAADGSFVVAWESQGQDGSGWGVFARRFAPDGQPADDEFQVNTYIAGDQTEPALALDGDGNLLIVWQSYAEDSAGNWGIYARRYLADGTPAGSEFEVAANPAPDQQRPAVAMNQAGQAVIVWDDGDTVMARCCLPDGTAAAGEFVVNTYRDFEQSSAAVGVAADGSFVVCWRTGDEGYESWGWHQQFSVAAQRFAADASLLGGEFRVNTFAPDNQQDPVLAMAPDGAFVVAWQSWNQDGDRWGVFAQRYAADGTPYGGEFRANQRTVDHQHGPAVAARDLDHFLIAWQSGPDAEGQPSQDGSYYGVYARWFGVSDEGARPDLRVVQATPTNVAFGQPAALTFTVQNWGMTVSPPCVAHLWLSDDTVAGNADDVDTGVDVPIPMVPCDVPNHTVQVTTNAYHWPVPDPIGTDGLYCFVVRVDAGGVVDELDETDNTAVSSGFWVTAPNLVVSPVWLSPGAVAPGQSVTVELWVRNTGTAPAAASVAHLLLSDDNTLGNGDDWDGLFLDVSVPALDVYAWPGYPEFRTAVTFNWPVENPFGADLQYFAIVCADAGNEVPEIRETDNWRASNQISLTMPNLVVGAVWMPDEVVSGQSVDVTIGVRNIGTAAAGPSDLRLWVSADDVAGNADDREIVPDILPPVPAINGGSYAAYVDVTFTWPAHDPADPNSEYSLIVQADAENAVTEGVESDNTQVRSGILLIRPNLTVEAVEVPPTVRPGQEAMVVVTVGNDSEAAADCWTALHLWLSADGIPGNADDLDLGVFADYVPPLASGSSVPVAVMLSWPWPSPMAPGFRQYLVAGVDGSSQVYESDETDNTGVSAALTLTVPDLAVVDLRCASTVQPGQALAVVLTVWNRGYQDAPSATAHFWLSDNEIAGDGDDRDLGVPLEVPIPALGARQDWSGTVTVPWPQTDPFGTDGEYFVVVRLAGQAQVAELIDANNWGVAGPVNLVAEPVQLDMRTVGHFGGYTLDAVLNGTYAYALTSAGLRILDVTNPQRSVRVGEVLFPVHQALALALADGRLIEVDDRAYRVFDVSTPFLPARLVEQAADFRVATLDGTRLFAANDDTVTALELAQPESPVVLAEYPAPGPIADLAVRDGLLVLSYVHPALGRAAVELVDVADPARPRFVSRRSVGGLHRPAGGLAVFGNQLAVATEQTSLVTGRVVSQIMLLDLSEPSLPLVEGTYEVDGRVLDLALTQGILWTVEMPDGPEAHAVLNLVGVSDPAGPAGLSAVDLGPAWLGPAGDYAASLRPGENRALVAFGPLALVDAADVFHPTVTGTYSEPAGLRRVALLGSVACLATGQTLVLVDVSEPSVPRWLGQYQAAAPIERVLATDRDVVLVEPAAGAAGTGQLEVVRISEPEQPVGVATFTTAGEALPCILDAVACGDRVALLTGASPSAISEGELRILGLNASGQVLRLASRRLFLSTAPCLSWTENRLFVAGLYPGDAEPNNRAVEAVPLGAFTGPERVRGMFAGLQDVPSQGAYEAADWYSLQAQAGDQVSVDLRGRELEAGTLQVQQNGVNVRLYDPQGALLEGSEGLADAAEIPGYVLPATGRYLVSVTRFGDWVPGGATAGYELALAVNGDLPAATAYRGVALFDTTDPTAPTLVSVFNSERAVQGLAASGDYAYFSLDRPGMVQVVDYRDPAQPVGRGSCQVDQAGPLLANGPLAVIVSGDRLLAVDVSQPERPVALGAFLTPVTIGGLVAAGALNFVVADSLYLLSIQPQVTRAPDLAVAQVSFPGAVQLGTDMDISWTVRNRGLELALGSWTDAVFLSADATLDDHDIHLGELSHDGPLGAGDEYTARLACAVSDLPFGTYFVIVRTDVGDAVNEWYVEGNNLRVASRQVYVGLPDLVVSQLDVPPVVARGQVVTVTWTVRNQGLAPASIPTWSDTVYLSDDALLDPGTDLTVGATVHHGTLGPGGTYEASLSVDTAAMAGDVAYLIVVADSTLSVAEGDDEANNVFLGPEPLRIHYPDLAVTHILIPDLVGKGAPLPIEWTVFNRELVASSPAVTWTDTIYISADNLLDRDMDTVVGSVEHTGGLASRAIYHGQFQASTLDLAEGSYYVIAATDSTEAVYEAGRELDNVRVSDKPFRLGVPVLALGQAWTDSFEMAGQSRYYRVDVPAGQHLFVTLDDTNDQGHNELYVRFGSAPTRSAYDARYRLNLAADQQVEISDTRAGSYYVLAYAAAVPDAPAGFSLTAAVPAFRILGVSPRSAGNVGPVTLAIRGAGLPSRLQPVLAAADGTTRAAIRSYRESTDFVYATFDLTGVPIGLYDLRLVEESGAHTELLAALEVQTGHGAELRTELLAPGAVRFGQTFTIWVEYANVGDVDLPAPVLCVTSSTAAMTHGDHPPVPPGKALQLLGISQNGPAAFLRPGEVCRTPIQVTAGAATTRFSLSALRIDATPINWAEYQSSMRPNDVTPQDWTTLFPLVTARLGSTWSDYYAVLVRNATRLGQQGLRSDYLLDALRLEVAKVRGFGVSRISGFLVSRQDNTGIPGQTVNARTSAGVSVSAPTDAEGGFVFRDLLPGRYSLSVANFDFDTPPEFEITADSDILGVWLVAVETSLSGALSGQGLTLSGLGMEARNTVTSDSYSATTTGDGAFVFPHVTAGVYEFRVQGARVARTTPETVTISYGERVANVTVELQSALRLAGVVTSRATSQPVAGATVTLIAVGAGAELTAADRRGEYAFEGLTPASYELVVEAPGLARTWAGPVELTDADQRLDIALGPEASAVGTVTFQGQPAVMAVVMAELRGATALPSFSAVTDASGAFELRGLPPGTYDIRVFCQGVGHALDGVGVAEAETLSLGTIALVRPTTRSEAGREGVIDDVLLLRQLLDAQAFLNVTWLPAATAKFGLQAGGLWAKYLHSSPANPTPIQKFGSGSSIVEGSWLSKGVRDSVVTKANVEQLRMWAKAQVESKFKKGEYQTSKTKKRSLMVSIEDVMRGLPGAGAVELLDAPRGSGTWNFKDIYEIPGNLAGGVGEGDVYPDRRTVTGDLIIERTGPTSAKITYCLWLQVFDTIDFVPGDTVGAGVLERTFIGPMVLLETNGWAYDVPFEARFLLNIPDDTIQVPAGGDGGGGDQDESAPDDEDQKEKQDQVDAVVVRSFDPNDKTGPGGYGAGHYVAPGELMPFSVYYENDPAHGATAPAQIVKIEDHLDADLDWSTFEIGDINLCGDFWIDVPAGLQHYETVADLRPAGNDLLVLVTVDMDSTTGQLTWLFESLDPATLSPPDNALAGFLPPNDKALHNGEGHVTYLVRSSPDLASGTEIRNQAFNTFDINDPLATPITVNTIDAGSPTSRVNELPAQLPDAPFTVTWSGQDDANGSGIASYAVYVQDVGPSGTSPWTAWLESTTETTALFTGVGGHTYRFRSVATDGVGHVEDDPGTAETEVTLDFSQLRVVRLDTLPSGFVATFRRGLDASVLSLYDTEAGDLGPADVTVVGATVGPVAGSLVYDAAAKTLTFIRTGAPLAADTYTVTLRSAADAVKDWEGHRLDGDADGVEGGDYVAQVTVEPITERLLALPDVCRGPGQAVDVPVDDTGIPITLSDGNGLQNADFVFEYDPTLLTVAGVAPGPTLPADWGVAFSLSLPGRVAVSTYGTTALPAGELTLVRVQAVVPADAPYGRAGILSLEHVTLNEGTIAGVGDSAVQLVAYLGDATGNGRYSGLDVATVARVAAHLDSGFVACPLVDPVILGDVTGNGRLTGMDASFLARRVVGLPQPEIPDAPGTSGSQTRAKPEVEVSMTSGSIRVGGQAVLPVTCGATKALQAIDLAITYDTAVLDLTEADVTLGGLLATAPAAWTAVTNVDDAAGLIQVTLFTTVPLTSDPGRLLDLNWHVPAGVTVGSTAALGLSGELNEGRVAMKAVNGLITVRDNAAPVATADAYSLPGTSAFAGGSVLANDTDADGDPLRAVLVSDVTNGALYLAADGTFTYQPNSGFVGLDSFSYKPNDGLLDGGTVAVALNVTSTHVNQAPTITSAATVSVLENATTVLTVTATDPDAGDMVTYSLAGGADIAAFALDPTTGELTFLTPPDFERPADLGDTPGNNTYVVDVRATDRGGLATTQTVIVTVTEVNYPPLAVADLTTVVANTAGNLIRVLDNDSSAPHPGRPLEVTAVTTPAHGSAVVSVDGLAVTYAPATDYFGPDAFSYTVADHSGTTATAEVRVTVQFALHLEPGWNLVSCPVIPTDGRLAVLFAKVPVSTVWEWTWDGYRAATRMEPKRGYWLYLDAGQAVDVPVPGPACADPEVLLAAGWDLLCTVVETPIPAEIELNGQPWTWNAEQQSYEDVSVGGRLKPGRAYWVYSPRYRMIW